MMDQITSARLSKRQLLGALAAGATALGARPVFAAESIEAPLKAMAGDLDLKTVPVIDTHMHPVRRSLISQQYVGQRDDFTAAVLPEGDFEGKPAVRERLLKGYADMVMGVSRRTGYFDYIARVHGVPPTVEGFDSVLRRHNGDDATFTRYVQSVMDRENVAMLVIQSPHTTPEAPSFLVPPGRTAWTYAISQMTDAEWARSHTLTSLADVTAAIDKEMETAAANGCRGFKNYSAYYRSYALDRVSAADAETALKALLAVRPDGLLSQGGPRYDDPKLAAAAKRYQDYLFKHIYRKAGALERPIVIHSAAILHPALRADFNDPMALYGVFTDPDIVRAGTVFLLIHSGFPSHHVVAAYISQFPNVYVDTSHVSKYPGVLEEVYRALLASGPSYKIMHGSDTGGAPEELAYCAWNTRQTLARVLSDYKRYYGFTQADLNEMAHNILHKNARRLFNLPG